MSREILLTIIDDCISNGKAAINIRHSRESGNPEFSHKPSGFRVKPGMTAMLVFFYDRLIFSITFAKLNNADMPL